MYNYKSNLKNNNNNNNKNNEKNIYLQKLEKCTKMDKKRLYNHEILKKCKIKFVPLNSA